MSALTFEVAADYKTGMVVLSLDTTTAAGSTAVLRGSQVLIERTGAADVPHGRRLPGDLFAVLAGSGVALADIDLYAVASGPGAFTGLRIGIATIQGLAFSQGRPVAAVSALDALAHAVWWAGDVRDALVAVWMDAARGEVFSSLYRPDGEELIALEGPSVGSPGSVLARWRPLAREASIVFVGDGAVRYRDQIGEARRGQASVIPRTPSSAAALGRLAIARAGRGDAGPPHAIRPLYVRRPDAELARDRRGEELADRA